jgi:hypothetical protein
MKVVPRLGPFRRYAFLWVTLGFFLFSLAGHWLFAWFRFVEDQRAHGQPVEVGTYAVQTLETMFENWQSEFLQLIWQVAGLAFFLFVGSPQSREGQDVLEAKIDRILRKVDPEEGAQLIRELEQRYE